MWSPGSYNEAGEGPGSFTMTSFTRDSASGLGRRTKAEVLAGGYESNKTIPVNCSHASRTNGSDLVCEAARTISIQDENLTLKLSATFSWELAQI